MTFSPFLFAEFAVVFCLSARIFCHGIGFGPSSFRIVPEPFEKISCGLSRWSGSAASATVVVLITARWNFTEIGFSSNAEAWL
jgi:hypothetical protein